VTTMDRSALPGQPLTTRERQVVEHLARGHRNRAIGEQLGLSPLTVKSYLTRIGRKLGTGDRAGIVAAALRSGQLALPTVRPAERWRVPAICACRRCTADLAAGTGLAGRLARLPLPAPPGT